jgi:hypothetical protein
MIEHLLVKDYNNDIFKKNNHVDLNIFYEFPKDFYKVLRCLKVSHHSLHLP